jgi:ArsR family transcriptional regulator
MNTHLHVPIHARLGALAEPTRTRLLLLLARHELSVGELCGAVQLPQSTVSRHLRVLLDEGWVVSRPDGQSRYYRLATELEPNAQRLWQVVGDAVSASVEAEQDAVRAQQAVRERRTRSQEFFSTAASDWETVRSELFGPNAGMAGLLALLDPSWRVGDLGCGTGLVAAALAPFVGSVIGVDESDAMLEAARRRLTDYGNVEIRQGALEHLPLDDGELDAAIVSLALHYVPAPVVALGEARRVVRGGGRVVVIDMMAHERAEYREQMGHVWPGFTEEQMGAWLGEAGFGALRWSPLPASRRAKGPLLFVMSGIAE